MRYFECTEGGHAVFVRPKQVRSHCSFAEPRALLTTVRGLLTAVAGARREDQGRQGLAKVVRLNCSCETNI